MLQQNNRSFIRTGSPIKAWASVIELVLSWPPIEVKKPGAIPQPIEPESKPVGPDREGGKDESH